MASKQRVLLLGATGETGGSILNGLLEHTDSFVPLSPNYDFPVGLITFFPAQDVEALVRPSSIEKPAVKALVERGVQIRVGDTNGPTEDLVGLLTGVDVLISAIDPGSLLAQIQLATAAKQAGVKRFVPCAFTTVTPPGGVMRLRDSKEQVYQHIRKLYLPYTIIDVGYWYQLSFPTLPSGRVDYAALVKPNVDIHADGNKPTMITDLRDIGRFVALIIKDPRTLNHSVFAYGDVFVRERNIRAHRSALGREDRTEISEEIVAAREVPGRGIYAADYEYNKYVRGDNTPAYAKYLGYLNARELYPEFQPQAFKEFLHELLDGKVARPYTD
ncbi:Isoflavone reductase family protein [Mycena venus]|uniref:Isoflavone reductase family protein n=1 Tax=Mycena venus TaxID=2733690 RepID=A0A8H6X5W7_9AGAR|nr:Isoflavone reductase family protein [Mycena venus]